MKVTKPLTQKETTNRAQPIYKQGLVIVSLNCFERMKYFYMNLFFGLSGSRLLPVSVVLSTDELRLSSWAELFSPSIELFIEVSAYSDLQIIGFLDNNDHFGV